MVYANHSLYVMPVSKTMILLTVFSLTQKLFKQGYVTPRLESSSRSFMVDTTTWLALFIGLSDSEMTDKIWVKKQFITYSLVSHVIRSAYNCIFVVQSTDHWILVIQSVNRSVNVMWSADPCFPVIMSVNLGINVMWSADPCVRLIL